MRKRIGNDFLFYWIIKENNVIINPDAVIDFKIIIRHRRTGSEIVAEFDVVNSSPSIKCENLLYLGIYDLIATWKTVDYSFEDDFRDSSADVQAFEIVSSSSSECETDLTVTSEIAIGFEGADAFEVWLKNGNEGKTYEDYIAFLQKPAMDAATAANDAATLANSKAQLADSKATLADQKATLANEAASLAAQKATLANDAATLANTKAQLADSATTNANNAEGLRATAESGRASAEGLRVTNESNRVTVEGNRITAEQGRVTAENSRVSAESTRGSNETARISNENIRISQETARVNAENARVASGAELKTNMSTNIETDKASTTKYPQLKALYDWATGRFLTMTQTVSQTIGATGARLTKLWATDIESTNMPTVAGVSLSTTFASKSSVTDYIVLYQRKIATVVNGVITAIQDTWDAHNSRVTADSATVKNLDFVKRYYQMCYDNNMFDSIKFAWLGEGGGKFRTSGIYSYFTKIYSMLGGNDASQVTSTNQPYLSGNIAPNERYGLKNPNGGGNFMTHPTISFAATDAWSVTTVLNWSSDYKDNSFYAGNNSVDTYWFGFRKIGNNTFFRIKNGTTIAIGIVNISNIVGKNNIISVVASGDNTINLYINNVFIETISLSTAFVFNGIIQGSTPAFIYNGSIHSHIIRSQALTQQQVTAEYNLLRSYIPEIENVTIGTQTWATSNCEMIATPQGNLIAEMQANVNVEKITNTADRDFSSDTGFWNKNARVTIADGICHFTNVAQYGGIVKNILTIGKYYKVNITVSNFTSGNVRVAVGGNGDIYTANGTYTLFKQCVTNANIAITTGIAGATYDIDNISYEEIGWSGSQELYDGIYAQTAGTVEQKTYAAVKAAAMWCRYDNDVAKGAVYGKLYNWFAVKLMQMDIDYYNIANPATTWGWRVPTKEDFQTLSTFLGGDAVSSGKLRKEGTAYWVAPNTGATNESGFTALGSGYRDNSSGSFSAMTGYLTAWTILSGIYFRSSTTSIDYPTDYIYAVRGCSLRLIKN